jgi:alkylation response protein AidB-like acyl-CoA dehydrogenase
MNIAVSATEQELIAAAEALQPELERRSGEIDKLRQLPQDLADKLAQLGFYRLVVPEDLGGLGISPEAFCKICETLAMANGSTGWCVFIGATSQYWRWGSGCRNAQWISGGVHEVDVDGQRTTQGAPLTRVFFKPEEIEIHDNWHVSGMRGSGSSDYVADNVWVSAERLSGNVEDTAQASKPIYQFPKFALLGIPIGAICLGMARASVEEVIRVSKEKTPQGSRRTLALRPSLHIDLAEADTALNAARALFYQSIQEGWHAAQSAPGSLQDRRAMRTATVHAVNVSIQVIDKMYSVMGGTSVFETSCLQQHFRDVHVASQHMMVGEPIMELAGRVMLGLDDEAFGL